MKRFHGHLHVADLAHSIGFHSKLFGADYAKWMLDDPAAMKARAEAADGAVLD